MKTGQDNFVLRPSILYLFMGAMSCAVGVYILLYAAGIVDVWLSFAPKETLTLDDARSWSMSAFMLTSGSIFIMRWFATVVLTPDSITYRWFGTKSLTWRDVTNVRIKSRQGEISIRGPSAKISIIWDFPLKKLVPIVLEMVREHSPNCVIEGEWLKAE